MSMSSNVVFDLKYEWRDVVNAPFNEELFVVDYSESLQYVGPVEQTDSHVLRLKFTPKALYLELDSMDIEQNSFEPIIKVIKLRDIEEEAKLYLGIIKAMYEQTLKISMEEADTLRSNAHRKLANIVEDNLQDLGLKLKDNMYSTDLAKDIISTWFDQIGYCETIDRAKPHPSIGSFIIMYGVMG